MSDDRRTGVAVEGVEGKRKRKMGGGKGDPLWVPHTKCLWLK
jgi:hypothetical protein